MSGGWPLSLDLCAGNSYGASTASTIGTAVASSASANTKGAYVTISASTTTDTNFIIIHVLVPASLTPAAFDVAIGAAASEQVVISNLVVAACLGGAPTSIFTFPLHIPAGTRISSRSQCTTGSTGVYISVNCYDSGFTHGESPAGIESIGFVAGSTIGTTITVSASANTKGSYVQLVASSARDYVGLAGVFDGGTAGFAANTRYMADVAIGGAGSEKDIISNVWKYAASDTWLIPFIPINIPAGTRISARAQCDTASSASPHLTLYGVYL